MEISENEQLLRIEKYYQATQGSYQRWGQDLLRPGLYSLHFGYDLDQGSGRDFDNRKAQTALTDTLIDFAQVKDCMKVLDSGCGTGTVSYRIMDRLPRCKVYGINISRTQLEAALLYNDNNNKYPFFYMQDYHWPSFGSLAFDRVLFCESLIHSSHKDELLVKSAKVLREGGSLVVADYFRMKEPQSDEVRRLWMDLKTGWELPYFLGIADFSNLMGDAGLSSVVVDDLTTNVRRSVTILGDGCKTKLDKGDEIPHIIRSNRLASIAFRDLLLSGNLGYFFVKGNKT